MSGDDLRVTTEHLGDLSVEQARVAAKIRSATVAVDGVDAAVRTTHGSIASATSSALEAVLAARSDAGTKIAAIADDLSRRLTDAANRYDRADDETGGALNTQMQTR